MSVKSVRVKSVRWSVALYTLVFLALTTWPGATIINQVKPFVLGLPFNLFAIGALIMGALVLLTALYLSEARARGDD